MEGLPENSSLVFFCITPPSIEISLGAIFIDPNVRCHVGVAVSAVVWASRSFGQAVGSGLHAVVVGGRDGRFGCCSNLDDAIVCGRLDFLFWKLFRFLLECGGLACAARPGH